ncbi:hypothetical protein CBR_g11879 [Chara braunii]|uniref:Uncharacterized protein n=1 Tax=Chara braunii TaxID=69332 RepID=A0A388JS61_CHABU|nr:hypothetical protein CBR_g11879 [Chara braunii]|eukprot:GBG60654.1 hypothetical protein CBR_g11879 [Chara braunii]
MYGAVEGDRDAACCRGEKETSQVGHWWVQHGDGVPLLQSLAIRLTHTWTCASPAERNWVVHECVQVKRRNQLGFIKLTRLVEISTNLRLSRCQGTGSGYVLPWEDAEEETEDAIPLPRDEGVQLADRVTAAQRERQVQHGRKDRLSKAPPNVETYFGHRATVLMSTELESVYDPEPHPMAQDSMEAESWSDPDDVAVESEPRGSDDDDDDTPPIRIPRPHTRASTAAAAPSPTARPPSSTPEIPLRGPGDRVVGTTPHPSTDRRGHGEQGTRECVEEGDDGDGDDRERYEGSSEDEDDPGYSTTRRHGDDDDEGGNGTQPAGGLRRSERQRGDRCSGTGREGSGPGVGGAGHTGGAGRAGGGGARRESASSTRTVYWVDEWKRILSAEVTPSPTEVAPSPAEFAAASAEGAGRFADVGGEGVQVGRSFAQLGASLSDDIFDVSLGLPPTPAGERVSGDADAAATPRMLETGIAAGDVEVEYGGAGGGDACERLASPVQGVCVLPLGGAMSAGELERQAREDPLQADCRGRMDEASRRLMAKGPAYVPCSPSVPSSITDVITPAHAEGPSATRSPPSAPAGESPSPRSRKKKMRAGKSLRTRRRVTQTMQGSQPGLAGLHSRTRAALGGDVAADLVGWQERVSTLVAEEPMTAPAEATLPRTGGCTTGMGDHGEHIAPPGRSMVGRILREDVRAVPAQRPSKTSVVWESSTDDLEMPRGQRRRVSVYDLLRAQGGVEAAP